MKIFVTGAAGQLGSDLCRELKGRGHKVFGSDILDSGDMSIMDEYLKADITSFGEVLDAVSAISPDAIMHCAAWTGVDDAEREENRQKVYAINVTGTENIAKACVKVGSKLLYLSTDYVFGGRGDTPLRPDDGDFSPLNYYGKTKLYGEEIIRDLLDEYFIVRIAWVFGKNGKNFIRTMLSLSDKYDKVRVVDDQIGTPTYTVDLSVLLSDMIETSRYGTYHATNDGGYISWADLAEYIFEVTAKNTKVERVSTSEFGNTLARRPHNSRLDKGKLIKNGFNMLPDWKDAVKRYIAQIQ